MVKIEKPAILIGLPRSGTTWVYNYIRLYYEKYGIVLPESRGINLNMYDEWFDNDRYHDKDRIEMLEGCRKCGIEVGYKMLVGALSPNQSHKNNYLWKKYGEVNLLDWFKEFYKETDIIILKRRNLWKTYISYLFHHTIRTQLISINLKDDREIHPWHADTTSLNKTIETYKIDFRYDDTVWNKFIDDVRFFNNDVINKFLVNSMISSQNTTRGKIRWKQLYTHVYRQITNNHSLTLAYCLQGCPPSWWENTPCP